MDLAQELEHEAQRRFVRWDPALARRSATGRPATWSSPLAQPAPPTDAVLALVSSYLRLACEGIGLATSSRPRRGPQLLHPRLARPDPAGPRRRAAARRARGAGLRAGTWGRTWRRAPAWLTAHLPARVRDSEAWPTSSRWWRTSRARRSRAGAPARGAARVDLCPPRRRRPPLPARQPPLPGPHRRVRARPARTRPAAATPRRWACGCRIRRSPSARWVPRRREAAALDRRPPDGRREARPAREPTGGRGSATTGAPPSRSRPRSSWWRSCPHEPGATATTRRGDRARPGERRWPCGTCAVP